MTDLSLAERDPNASALDLIHEAKSVIARAIAESDTDTLFDLRSRASAYELKYQRDGARETANDAGEVKVRAERGLGQIDAEIAPHGVNQEFREVGTPAPLSGVHQDTRAAWRKLGTLSDPEFERRLNAARSDENAGVSTTRILHDTSLGGLKQSEHVEWYTPSAYIEAARKVLGQIDLDPASSKLANGTVKADTYYTEGDDGLAREWHGRIWLNPPYGKGSGLFATKLVEEYGAKRVEAAILLLNAYGFDSGWFQPLWNHPICFTDHRIQFTSPTRDTGGPANANIFVYLGPDKRTFAETFAQFGAIVERIA